MNHLRGGVLILFSTPSVSLPELLDILQILILQVLSKSALWYIFDAEAVGGTEDGGPSETTNTLPP